MTGGRSIERLRQLGDNWLIAELGCGVVQAVHVGAGRSGSVGSEVIAAARDATTEIDQCLAEISDGEVAAAEEMVADLGTDARLIAFFSEGITSLANQAVAQFAGWNIPGVGEGDQRFRPRTRIYDTLDPDTIAQVSETLAYERTSFVFLPCPTMTASSTRVWAEALLPRITSELGDAAGHRVVEVLNQRFHAARVLPTNWPRTLANAGRGDLTIAALLVGVSRAVDARAVFGGAREAIAALSARLDTNPNAALTWPRYLAHEDGEPNLAPAQALLVPFSDRLGRFSAWAATIFNTRGPNGGRADVASQPASGLTPTDLGLGGTRARPVDIHTVAPPETGDAAARRHALTALCQFANSVAAAGHPVRILEAADYSPASYGALCAQVMLEAELVKVVHSCA